MKVGVVMTRRSSNRDGHVVIATDEDQAGVTRAVANVCQLQAVTMVVDTATTNLDEDWRSCKLTVDGEVVAVWVLEILGDGALFAECGEDSDESFRFRYIAGRYEDGLWSFSSVITTGRGSIADHNKAARAAALFIFSS